MTIRGFNLEGSGKNTRPQKTESASHSRRAIPTIVGLVNCKPGKVTLSFVRGHTTASHARRPRV